MSSHVETTNVFTEPIGMRGNRVAPRWVSMLVGLAIGAGLMAIEVHGVHQIVTAVVAVVLFLTLVVVGRPRIVPRDSASTRQH